MSTNSPNSSVHFRYLCPLSLLDCYTDNVDLVEDIQIRRKPTAFKEQADLNGIQVKFVAVLPYYFIAKTPEEASKESRETDNLLYDLVSGFRLCHAGNVIAGPLLPAMLQNAVFSHPNKSEAPFFTPLHAGISTFSSTSLFDLQWPLGSPFDYKLQFSDVNIINEIIKELHNSRKEGKQDTLFEALSRFHSAYHGNPNDRLIDQMIAFESLYIGDDKELGYKLALRTAFLLTTDEDDRKVILNDMKKAYELRGHIVHGSKKVDTSKLEEIFPKTEEYLRQSIRKFLKLLASGYSLDALKKGKNKNPAMLDENILKNGALLA